MNPKSTPIRMQLLETIPNGARKICTFSTILETINTIKKFFSSLSGSKQQQLTWSTWLNVSRVDPEVVKDKMVCTWSGNHAPANMMSTPQPIVIQSPLRTTASFHSPPETITHLGCYYMIKILQKNTIFALRKHTLGERWVKKSCRHRGD